MSSTVATSSERDVEAIYRVLRNEATKRGLKATLHTHLIRWENERILILPVYLEGIMDAYGRAVALQGLEDAWNNQKPRPRLRLFITPASR